jgi:hypothetical protein
MVRRDVILAGTAAGDATALLRLELEGTLDELIELRGTFSSATDEEDRAVAGEAVGRSARQAMLLDKALRAATDAKGATGPTPLDTAVEARAGEIERLRQTSLDESSTVSELGDEVGLLGTQDVSIMHGQDRGDDVESMRGTEGTTIAPEEALPETTDDAEQRWAGDLADRVTQQRDQVKSLRNRILPESPNYSLVEFAGVHKRWWAFQSQAQEEQDPGVRMALGLLGEPYKIMGTDLGSTVVSAEAGIARGMLMNMAVDVLAGSLGGGSTTQFGGALKRAGPSRSQKVTGEATAPRYAFGELYPAGAHDPGRAGETGSASDLAGQKAAWTSTGFSGVAMLPPMFQPPAARGAGLTTGPDVPLVGMRRVSAFEGWSYLVDVFGGPGRDVLISREHKVVPPEVVQYLLARQQQVATLATPHTPEAGGKRLGSAATRSRGVEGAMATATETYLGGEAGPKVPEEVERLHDVMGEQQKATGVSGPTSKAARPEAAIGALVGDMRTYLDGFFAEHQDMAWRLAAIFHIANTEHNVGAQLMKLLEGETLMNMVKEAIKISGIMMGLQLLGPLGNLAAAAYSAHLRSQGVSNVTALISIAAFCHRAADADSLMVARAWGYAARNIADDAAELFENMVTSPVSAAMEHIGDRVKGAGTPRELADGLAPLMKDPVARKQLMADLDARIEALHAQEAITGKVDPELASLVAFKDGLLGRSTIEGAKASDEALPGMRTDTRVDKLTAEHTRSTKDVKALETALGELNGKVPLVQNPDLPGNEVRVRYGDKGGLRVEVGRTAQPEHVRRHVDTVKALRRYEGVTGRIFQLGSKISGLITGHPSYGQVGFEARLEVKKLRSIQAELEAGKAAIEAKADRLTGDAKVDLDAESAAITREIAHIEGQLTRHEADLASYEPGRGWVAAENTEVKVPEAVAERARALRAKAEAAAPGVRGALDSAVVANGGKLVDLEFELKELDSLSRKINDRSSERGPQTPKSIDKAASKINDALRYTVVYDGANYLDGYNRTKAALEAAGYTFVRESNAWAEPERFGGGYRGINATFKTKDGLEFEVQFHTPESHDMKVETHPLYEEFRAKGTSEERKKEINEEQRRRWGGVPYPAGIPAPGGGP